jgi:regulator of protease activity HflC (stomatin/prohibitin superfamily)
MAEASGARGGAGAPRSLIGPTAALRLALSGAAAILVLVLAIKTFRIETIQEIDQAGQVVFCGLWNDFYKIEKGLLQVHMSGQRGTENFVKVKTIDGNDVFVELTIQYQMEPKKAATLLVENGAGKAYQAFWVKDYARAICRYDFGELSTEEFFVASKRDQKVIEARDHLNALLEPHGIHVTQVLVQQFHFRPEYDEKIREKNLAEQEAERWKSQQQANTAQQARLIQQARKEMTKQLASFQGDLDRSVARAEGEADRVKLEAEAYAKRVTLAAEANFHKASNEAEAVKAGLAAEAAGMKALRDAMAGEGGRTLVALEYAKKLEGLHVSGRPVIYEGVVQQFSHEQKHAAAAAAAGQAPTGARGGGE